MILSPSSGRANSLLPFGIASALAGRVARSSALIRWARPALPHKAERKGSWAYGMPALRKCLIGLGFFGVTGAGRDDAPPPPLRFVQPRRQPAELLAARKMGSFSGGSGRGYVA